MPTGHGALRRAIALSRIARDRETRIPKLQTTVVDSCHRKARWLHCRRVYRYAGFLGPSKICEFVTWRSWPASQAERLLDVKPSHPLAAFLAQVFHGSFIKPVHRAAIVVDSDPGERDTPHDDCRGA